MEGPPRRSAATLAATIVGDLKPSTVVDVGCGTGALLAALRERGCRVCGLEYGEAALARCRARRLDVEKCDLENDDYPSDRTHEVAISMGQVPRTWLRARARTITTLERHLEGCRKRRTLVLREPHDFPANAEELKTHRFSYIPIT